MSEDKETLGRQTEKRQLIRYLRNVFPIRGETEKWCVSEKNVVFYNTEHKDLKFNDQMIIYGFFQILKISFLKNVYNFRTPALKPLQYNTTI